jgi:SPOR domain
MATTETPQTVPLGEEGDPCPECGSPLAADQRYCLECGSRRGGQRVPFSEMRASRNQAKGPTAAAAAPATARAGEWTPLAGIGLVALIALILVAGILIGRGSGGSSDEAPQVVRVDEGSGGGQAVPETASDSTGEFKSDWPAGKEGFTIELGVLAKDGATPADVSAAKEDAAAKGAPDVGVLDSDAFESLPPGNYMVYSGEFDSRADAQDALKDLKADFPDARVVEVAREVRATRNAAGPKTGGAGGGEAPAAEQVQREDLQELENLSGDDYVKRSKKLADETKVEGTPPPKDNKAPGGGSQAIEIK